VSRHDEGRVGLRVYMYEPGLPWWPTSAGRTQTGGALDIGVSPYLEVLNDRVVRSRLINIFRLRDVYNDSGHHSRIGRVDI